MNFKTYSDLWIKAVNDKETEGLSEVLSDDFVWSNDRFNWVVNKQDTIDWCKSTDLIGIDFSSYYEKCVRTSTFNALGSVQLLYLVRTFMRSR